MELGGRVALVSGAASGIGLALARALLAQGARVALTDVRTDVLQGALEQLGATRQRALGVALDVAEPASWAEAVEQVSRALGPISLLFSNAGVNFVGPTHEATLEDWEFCLRVNLGGAILGVRTLVPRMIERGGGGHIVITASVSGLYASAGAGVYSTSKFALVGLAESLRADLASHGIGVSVLCPGPVKSQLFESTAAVRPAALAATGAVALLPPGVAREQTPIFTTALTPDEVARQVIEGIHRNELYILTHAEIRPVLEARAAALLTALPAEPVDPRRIEASAPLLDASLYRDARGD
ncbi:MAG TPA: SDR family oxidoreductase [Steroidobacteraceae bacterium]|nr:SDR family oxidoreductase [Steroidobacteraceae bacterium]